METIFINQDEFESLAPLRLDSDIISTESILYYMPDSLLHSKQLFKYLIKHHDEGFMTKIRILLELEKQKSFYPVPGIVYPTNLVMTGAELTGYTMPYIKGENLKLLLNSQHISHKKKINYLKQIGELLTHMKKSRASTPYSDFYLYDIHESNFMIERTTGCLKYVDIDSCSIKGLTCGRALYTRPIRKFNAIPEKHPQIKGDMCSYIAPSEDVELYCYIIMLLNYISKYNIALLLPYEYADYLDYLASSGFPLKLLECFNKIYTPESNTSPVHYLDDLPQTDIGSFENYKKARRL